MLATPEPHHALLAADGVALEFKGVKALQGVSFKVRQGELFSIIGPNGAGKTSLLNCVSGRYQPTTGEIRFDGQRISGRSPAVRAQLGVARTFQNLALFAHMSVIDNIKVGRHHLMRKGFLARWPVLLLLSCSLNALADGGQECMARRARTPAEARLAQDIVAALKAALPVAPAPWQKVDVTEPRPPTAQVYATPGCPESHSIKAVYRDDGAALAAGQALQANAARMEALIAELQDALGKADAQRITSLNAELLRLQSGGAAAITTVAIEVNGRGSTTPDAGGQPLAIAGARAAYAYGQGSERRVVMWLGDAGPRPGTDKAADAGAALSNAHARHAMVSIAGPAAETFARLVRLGELQAVLKRSGSG